VVTDQQRARWRADRDVIAKAADKARREASQGQAAASAGLGLVVPYDRFVFVGLLDELAWAASRGELPRGLRAVAVEMAETILKDTPARSTADPTSRKMRRNPSLRAYFS
jgi:hypothetical protein